MTQPENDQSGRDARVTSADLFGCDGRCGQYGDCTGTIQRVKVKSGDGRRTWGTYHYCETAIATDTKAGYIVEPNAERRDAAEPTRGPIE